MFNGTNPFYHQCVRKIVVAFGTLFNNIYIGGDRVENPLMRLPLTYSPKQKWLRRLSESMVDSETGQTFSTTQPRMAFALTTWEYDASRKRTTMTRKVRNDSPLVNYEKQYRFTEVPYNFTFELYIVADTMDNGLRIVEQILPYFTPSYTLSVNFTDIDRKIDLPVTLTSVSWEDDYEGNFDSTRSMLYTLSFEVKGYVIGPIKDAKLILETQVGFKEFEDIQLVTGESKNFALVWDRAVQPGTTGPAAPLALTGTAFDVWEDIQDYGVINPAWNAGGP